MLKNLVNMAARQPMQSGRLYRRVMRAKRSLGHLGNSSIPTIQGSFSHDLTHYQSHCMPLLQSGSLGGLDRFVRQQDRFPDFFLGQYPVHVVGPVGQPMTQLYSARYWETAQSMMTYNTTWSTKSALKVDSNPTISPPTSSTTSTTTSTSDKPSQSKEEKLKHIADALAMTLPKFFTQMHNYSIYSRNVVFENRIRGVTTSGLDNYSWQLTKYKTLCHLVYGYVGSEVLNITQHPDDMTVRVRWRIVAVGGLKPFWQFWRFFSKKGQEAMTERIEGFSLFYVGEDGRVNRHVADKMMPDDEKQPVLDAAAAKLAKLKLAGLMALILPGSAFGGALLGCN